MAGGGANQRDESSSVSSIIALLALLLGEGATAHPVAVFSAREWLRALASVPSLRWSSRQLAFARRAAKRCASVFTTSGMRVSASGKPTSSICSTLRTSPR
jgi:hypothetical protein